MNETATIDDMPRMTEAEQLSIPLDLSLWNSTAQLRKWIVSNVATLDWTLPELLEQTKNLQEVEPKALLIVMTLAYVTGVFGAEEIAPLCSSDAEFRMVRPKLPPLPGDLKQFRKENRALLKWCLVDVITEALKSKFIESEGVDILPPGLRRRVVDNAVERLEIARHMDRSTEL